MGVYERMNALGGWTEYIVTGVLPAAFLNGCAAAGITMPLTAALDDYSLQVRVAARDAARVRRIARQTQCALRPVASGGAPKLRRALVRRIVPVLLLCAMAAGLVWSKLFLWEIEVRGNETVPTAVILDALRECGVDSGSFWPGFTSDRLRSELLLRLPELAWATVNVHGSRAEVIVRERVAKPPLFDADAPTDIAAARTGFITRLLVLRGAPQARRGSAVTAGDTLISGRVGSRFMGDYTVHAVGDVEAETYYELLAVSPAETLCRRPDGGRHSRWALVIGKNRYNFYRNSSISGGDCDKIIKTYRLDIPGLFSLPLSLVRETQQECTLTPQRVDAAAAAQEMELALNDSLLRCIGENGTVEEFRVSRSAGEGYIAVCLRARCSEHIGVEVPMAGDISAGE